MTIAARKLVVATGNAHKTREIARILGRFEVSSLVNHPPVEFPAEGGDYFDNARVKAIVAARAIGTACVADDSGLEVAALGGAPGAYSARYGGAGLDDRGRFEALLTALQSFPTPRGARFFCAAAVALPDGRCQVAEGVCEGQILMQAKGDGGFGYDPIFLPEGQVRVMAELADVEKDGLSHRGRAFRALEPAIEELLAGWRD
ncbi:MAG: RdgB/HAM1 family non-canonical purine NTP pyrophosphatase [Proteobacteria bacterium]|nr:RdgB/HAM1 family non-canonical purine NTP pyrophosphatase [Pseudomonadota bacterium]